MTTSNVKIAKTSQSRVFLIEGRARPDHAPSYQYCYRMMGVTQAFGDVTRIENPDPSEYGKFIEVSSTRGAIERATTSLEGRYMMELKSTLLDLARQRCAVDVQLHLGECTDPSEFNTFKKALVLEKAYLTNFSTDDLGALQSGDDNPVNETADISAQTVYEILPMSLSSKAGSIITNEIVDVVICDTASCGDCGTESDGCQRIYAISKAAGGSPGTPPDIVFSLDKGINWYAHDIDTLTAAQDASGVDCIGSYVVVVSNAAASLSYALKTDFTGTIDPTFTEVTTGFVAGGEPNAISSVGNTAFIVGDFGYVYLCTDPTVGVTVLDAGTTTIAQLNAVHAIASDFAVAVGNGGAVLYTDNGTSWTAATSPVAVGVNLNCVFVKSETEWYVGSDAGNLYYTLDGGATWTLKAFTGSGTGSVLDIQFATDSVVYLAHQTVATKGRILRSYNGGNSWTVLPEGAGTIPVNDKVNKLAVCSMDANFVVGVGLADDGVDGFIVVGQA